MLIFSWGFPATQRVSFLLLAAAMVWTGCGFRPTDSAAVDVNIPDLTHFVQKPDVLRRVLLSCPDWSVREMWHAGPRFEKKDKSIEVRLPLGVGAYETFQPEYVFQFSSKPPAEGGVVLQ